MENKYEQLFDKFTPDLEEEKKELAIILDHLFERFDSQTAMNIAKTHVNLSRMYGIPLKKIRERVLEIPVKEDLDSNLLMIAGVVYESKWDRLEGSTFALGVRDVLRLKLNTVKGLEPDRILEGTENGKRCMIYFYRGLPLILVGDLNDSKN